MKANAVENVGFVVVDVVVDVAAITGTSFVGTRRFFGVSTTTTSSSSSSSFADSSAASLKKQKKIR